MSRPLSSWISFATPSGLGPVNDGDRRADARILPDFAGGWHRVAVPWHDGTGYVLGLSRHNALAVELDSYGNPIPVSARAAASIAELETSWPAGPVDVAALAGEALPLRYWLLARLDAEGDPADSAFTLLPWDCVDRAIQTIGYGLVRGAAMGEQVELRHWFNPAVMGLTGPLEQLDYGLRTGDSSTVRQGAETLAVNLRDMPLRRIPHQTRTLLSDLIGRLELVDADLRYTVQTRLASTETDELDPAWFTATITGARYLSVTEAGPKATATLEVQALQARGSLALTSSGLVVTLIGVTQQGEVTAEAPGGPAVPMTQRGRTLYAVLPWEGDTLPDRLTFRLSAPEGGQE